MFPSLLHLLDQAKGPKLRVTDPSHLVVLAEKQAALCVLGRIAGMHLYAGKSGDILQQRQALLEARGIGVDDMVGASRNGSLAFFLYSQYVVSTHALIQSTVGVLKAVTVEVFAIYIHLADGVTLLLPFSIYQYLHNNKFNNQ